jgi:hypothetical protein
MSWLIVSKRSEKPGGSLVDRWWKFGEMWQGGMKLANLLANRAESSDGAVINVDFDTGNL